MSVLMIGIGAVSAIDDNTTNDTLSLDGEDITQDLSQPVNDSEVISADENESALSSNEDNEVIQASEDEGNVLSVASGGNDLISISHSGVLSSDVKKEEKSKTSTYSYYDTDGSYISTKIETKRTYAATIKIPKKYKKFFDGYKPSKKNKKIWKKYRTYKKIEKKQLKKMEKSMRKAFLKAYNNHWTFDSNKPVLKIKNVKKNIVVKVYYDMNGHTFSILQQTGESGNNLLNIKNQYPQIAELCSATDIDYPILS